MPNQTKTCRVCGAKYESCKSIRNGSRVFNWREVACSPECGAKYLQMVEQSRKKEETDKTKRGGRRKTAIYDEASDNFMLNVAEENSDSGVTPGSVQD